MQFLITAGPTREAIDPVRYLSNHSSGKMGFALAQAATEFNHQVTLIAGPNQLHVPHHADYVPVESAIDMHHAVQQRIARMDIVICCAAVADYRVAHPFPHKIKKSSTALTLELIPNPDILADCRNRFQFNGVLIGFAAETENLETNARAKLQRKNCDLIIANDVSRADIGFNHDDNEILLIYPNETIPLPRASKEDLAMAIIQHALDIAVEKSA